jgi:predicted CXXCH cytochrome family protein
VKIPMKKALVATLVVVSLFLISGTVLAQGLEDSVLSGEQCKMCHPAEYDVWASTPHPNSITAVKESDHGSEDCLHCMSADYRWDETLTVETAKYGVTCVACHTPHDTPGDAKPAIADVGALCKDCHNAELEAGATAEAGATLRHAVTEMMGGYGAIGAEGSASVHDAACNACHLEGHLFVPAQSVCDTCHGGAVTIEDAGAAVRAKVAEVGAIEGLVDKWPAAYTNNTLLSSDDSGGIHNAAYAAAIVAAIDAQLAEAPLEVVVEEVVAEEVVEEVAVVEEPVALPESGGVPLATPGLLVIAGSLSLMGAYALRRRK